MRLCLSKESFSCIVSIYFNMENNQKLVLRRHRLIWVLHLKTANNLLGFNAVSSPLCLHLNKAVSDLGRSIKNRKKNQIN